MVVGGFFEDCDVGCGWLGLGCRLGCWGWLIFWVFDFGQFFLGFRRRGRL